LEGAVYGIREIIELNNIKELTLDFNNQTHEFTKLTPEQSRSSMEYRKKARERD
jgi:hypothetical protein